MKITNKQIAAIARASKSLSAEGLGNVLYVFDDGTFTEETASFTCLLHGDERIYPALRFKYPQTAQAVREEIAYQNSIPSVA